MQNINRLTVLTVALAGVIGILSGCAKNSSSPTSAGGNPTVSLSVLFSQSGTPGLFKTAGGLAVDSLRIDSAVVVFSRITFESHVDTVRIDTTGNGFDDDSGIDTHVTFMGPFVVHVRDTTAINFASQVIPAGTYDGIRFKIHKLMPGESHEDSDDRNGGMARNDSSVAGSSIMVWGAVKKNGVWTPFAFSFDANLTFKLKGTFTVPAATSTFNVALNFSMNSWFTAPFSGMLLDPTDPSMMNQMLIRRAIIISFEGGRCGHDRGDGHPDGGGMMGGGNGEGGNYNPY